jgi:hypothetical protein
MWTLKASGGPEAVDLWFLVLTSRYTTPTKMVKERYEDVFKCTILLK